jgi:hypothetical protein
MSSEWKKTRDERPEYGEAVMIIVNEVTQNITYCLAEDYETLDWFEPYHFDHDDDLKLRWDEATDWIYVYNL